MKCKKLAGFPIDCPGDVDLSQVGSIALSVFNLDSAFKVA